MNKESQGQALTEQEENNGILTRIRGRWTTFLSGRAGKALLPAAAVFLMGVLFSRTPLFFGAYPLGLALLCSNRRQTLPCFFGLCVGAATMGTRGLIYGVLYMLALLMRILFSLPQLKLHALPQSENIFYELPQLKVVTALTVAACTCAYELAVSGLSSGTLLFCLVTLIGCGSLCAAFSGFFSWGIRIEDILGRRRPHARMRSRWEKIHMEAGAVLLAFFCVFALRNLSLFGLNLSYLFSSFFTLYIARRFGALRGCAAGLIAAMGVSTMHAPAFGLLGLLTGMLWPLGAFYSMGIGTVVAIGWCSYVAGLAGFLGVGPELTVAALIALPFLPRLYSDAIAGEVREDRAAAEEALRALHKSEEENCRTERLSGAFLSLARAFSEHPRSLSSEKCFLACDDIFTSYCATCHNRVSCWDSDDRPGKTALGILAERIARGETFSAHDLPTHLLTDCEKLEPMLGDIRLRGASLWKEQRLCAGADYPSLDFSLTGELLHTATLTEKEEREEDPAAASAIRRLLSEHGIRPSAVRVCGKRIKKIWVASAALAPKQREVEKLREGFEAIVGCRLSSPVFESATEMMTMELHTAEQFGLEIAFASRAAFGSDVSGDCVSSFRSSDGFSYILLSDGMGTGRQAARTSGVCSLFLEKMLLAGNLQTVALKMLNRLISMREEEYSATVDLLEYDCFLGRAQFTKSGAASSYVRRDGNLFRLRSKTIPLGLVQDVKAENLQFDTQAGDVVIMLSDGVSQTSEDAPWLIEMLSKPLGQNLETAANTILEQAARRNEGRDDMTVVLARVCKR